MPIEQTRTHVNLDYAASTPLRASARQAQAEYDQSELAGVNPNSLHSLGRKAAGELERCRGIVARTLGKSVRASEIIFTGGGTEANFLALMGIAEGVRQRDRRRTRVLISAIEHDSMLDNLSLLHASGFTTQLVSPNRQGFIEPDTLKAAMGDDVALVTIMLANNETGVIQPIRNLAAVAHAFGAPFHTDAIQGYLHTPFDVQELGVDALSLAGHKIGGPVGIGALYISRTTPLRPRLFGGGQEAGRRPGTQDLRQIVALAAAAKELAPQVKDDECRLLELSNGLYDKLCSNPHVQATMGECREVSHLAGIVSITVEGVDSEELILQLDARGFEVSAGSACTSADLDASHVLTAMGIPRRQALGSLRISFDDRVRPTDLNAFAEAFQSVLQEV